MGAGAAAHGHEGSDEGDENGVADSISCHADETTPVRGLVPDSAGRWRSGRGRSVGGVRSAMVAEHWDGRARPTSIGKATDRGRIGTFDPLLLGLSALDIMQMTG